MEEGMYGCPLVQKAIDEGACYEINLVAERYVKKAILGIIEKQYDICIDVNKAHEICPSCIRYPFG
ncbi:hypothetical protein [Paenibacillus chitinolyticus]|uniref:hypothetical protein n=1 Tax=Paenibacillus chitinolyticus TaxID=79263 RepID=UPI001C45DF4A|nr:hypothetical protein [Paenibacillus chitinolyticus]MBV6712510.1 hypothetical protein [Paenibacillus chitinolyticus]